MIHSELTIVMSRLTFRALLLALISLSLGACVTSRIEDSRHGVTGLAEGEGVVIMAKSYHLGNETENDFITCVGSSISRGRSGLRVIPHQAVSYTHLRAHET